MLARGHRIGILFVVAACGGVREEPRVAGAESCQGQVLNLPSEPIIVEGLGSLRCSREYAFENEPGERREGQETIDYGAMSCMSGCPEGYEEQWSMLRVALHPDGSVYYGEHVMGHLDETGCFHAGPAIVRWDPEGRLLNSRSDNPFTVRLREGRLEFLVLDKIEHVLTVHNEQLLVNGRPCGTIAGAGEPGSAELALRIVLLPEFARFSAHAASP